MWPEGKSPQDMLRMMENDFHLKQAKQYIDDLDDEYARAKDLEYEQAMAQRYSADAEFNGAYAKAQAEAETQRKLINARKRNGMNPSNELYDLLYNMRNGADVRDMFKELIEVLMECFDDNLFVPEQMQHDLLYHGEAIEQWWDAKQGPPGIQGNPGKQGERGPMGTPGIAANELPEYQEAIAKLDTFDLAEAMERIKDLEAQVEELTEALADLEDS